MLGRKDFTQDELDSARADVEAQLAAYGALATSADGAAVAAFEPRFAEALLLALDRRFVHRVRMVTGKGPTPLNELELLVDSLMNHGGTMTPGTVIRYEPGETVLGIEPGARIELSVGDAGRLAAAVLEEIDARFVQPVSTAAP